MATHSIRRCPRRSQGIRSEGSRQGCMTTSAHAANVHAAVGSKLAEPTIEESAATNFVSWTVQLLVANTSTLVHDVVRASCQPSPMDEFKSNTAHPTARLVLVRHGMLQHKNMARSVPDNQTKSSSPIEPCFVLLAFILLNALVAALLQKHTTRGGPNPRSPIVVVEVVGTPGPATAFPNLILIQNEPPMVALWVPNAASESLENKFVSICLGHLGPGHLVPPQLFPI